MDSLAAKAHSIDRTSPDRVSADFDASNQSGAAPTNASVPEVRSAKKNAVSKKLNSNKLQVSTYEKKPSKIEDEKFPSQTDSKITLRLFEEADIEQTRSLIKRHHQNTVYGHHPFSNKKFDVHVEKALSRPDNMVGIVAEKDSRIIGAAWASAGQYALCEELILTSCHVITVDQDNLKPITRVKTFLRLIAGIKKWSDSIGAQEVLVHVTTGTNLKATDRLLRRSGAKCIGGGYVV